jgi:ABC-type multidrug transport system permease subunit
MRGLKRIALSGVAVCATIHQPSVAIFNEFDGLLLLKRGGEVVFFGDIGDQCSNLIKYFERFPATPRIQPGENPATWMLTTIGAGSANTNEKPFDYAGSYANSRLRTKCLEKIDKIVAERSPEGEMLCKTKFATSFGTQAAAVLFRAFKVYYRSPSYNLTRVMVSCIIALLFGSVYASQRVPETESDMNSRINSMYVAVLFLCVNAMNTVLHVFERERNMFYRHRAANMYCSRAILWAFTLAEVPFILLTSTAFSVLFYFIMGFSSAAHKFFLFFIFTTCGLMAFTFGGQMLVSLLRDSETAQGIGALWVCFTSLFSGILIRPSDIPPFWVFMYWVMPGHYLFEGIFMSQYSGDDTAIAASPGSSFFVFLGCKAGQECTGTAEQWVDANFVDWSVDSIYWNVLYFVVLLWSTLVVTYVALTNLDYRSN